MVCCVSVSAPFIKPVGTRLALHDEDPSCALIAFFRVGAPLCLNAW